MLHPVARTSPTTTPRSRSPWPSACTRSTAAASAPGDVVVVHGAGAIGSFIVAGALAAGAGAVVAVDVDPGRLRGRDGSWARRTPSTPRDADPLEAVRELTGSALADVTVEASGLLDGLSRVQRLTRRGGTILLVGLPKKEVSFNAVDLILREIDVMTTVAHVCDANLPAALALLAERDLAAAPRRGASSRWSAPSRTPWCRWPRARPGASSWSTRRRGSS